MKHLVRSFQENVGVRGAHFYDEDNCHFLNWQEVFAFLNKLPPKESSSTFSEKLVDTLANYNPDSEFLAVQQNGDSVSVELYSQAQ